MGDYKLVVNKKLNLGKQNIEFIVSVDREDKTDGLFMIGIGADGVNHVWCFFLHPQHIRMAKAILH